MTTPRIMDQNGSTVQEDLVQEFHVQFDCGVMRTNAHRQDSPYIESSTMIVDSSTWKIRAYPNGLNEKDVVLFVLMWDANRDMEADVKVRMHSIARGSTSLYPFIEKNITLRKGRKGDISAARFNTASMFDEHCPVYVENDGQYHLLLSIKIKTATSMHPTAPLADLSKNVSERLFHKGTSDVDIVVEGSRIPAHKLILSLVSPVFTAMFENQMQESVSNEIVISDFSEEVVRSMLRCIYDWNCVKSEVEKNPQPLLRIANKYELTAIESTASDHIIKSISFDNVIDTLLTASQFDRASIKTAAMEYITANAVFFFTNPDFADFVGFELIKELLTFMTTNNRIK